MNFIDLIKDSVLKEFTSNLDMIGILLSLVTAFLIALIIVYIYRRTYNGVVYSKSFTLLLILLAMITSLVIRTITSNLALSLGMVGALSIVRYRTAIKDPIDTGFIFWAIMAGVMAGVGYYLIAIVASIALGILYLIICSFEFKKVAQFLLIIKYDYSSNELVQNAIKQLPKHKLRNKTLYGNTIELTFDIEIKDKEDSVIDSLKSISGVETVNLISYHNDFGL
jgi:hypothetical protein